VEEVKEALERAREISRAIDATIAGRVGSDVSSFEIETNLGKRRLDKIPLKELLEARTYYQKEIARLEARVRRGDLPSARQVLVRF
jgi:hypothetical protein